MKKILYKFSSLILIVILATLFVAAQSKTQDDAKIAEEVRIAFERSAKYDFKKLEELKLYGNKVIPYLEPYLTGSNLGIRYLALDFLKNAREIQYIPSFLTAIRDSDPETSRVAAQYLYDNFDHQTLAQNAAVGEALRQGAANGHHSMSLIILLGYFPEAETEKALLPIRDKENLKYWTDNREIFFDAEILSNVPVYLSLYRIDKQKYFALFSDLIKKASSGEIEFLLFTLNYVDDKILLKQIFDKGIVNRKILASEYGIEGGLMPNPMRMADLTVNQFVSKLNLNLGFKLQETRYSPAKINLARQKISAKLAAM